MFFLGALCSDCVKCLAVLITQGEFFVDMALSVILGLVIFQSASFHGSHDMH